MSYSTKATTIAGVPLHSPQECPKWNRCSAPICPLDPLVSKRKMLPGEAVCTYISEAVKNDSSVIFEASGLSWLHSAITQALPELEHWHGPLRYRLKRAKNTGSKMAAVIKLRKG